MILQYLNQNLTTKCREVVLTTVQLCSEPTVLRLETGEEAPQSRVCDSNQTKRFDVNAVWFTSAVTKLTQHDLGLALISCHHLPTYFKNALCHVGLHWYDIGSPTGHLCHNHCLQSHIWNKLKAEDKAVSAIANRRHLLGMPGLGHHAGTGSVPFETFRFL